MLQEVMDINDGFLEHKEPTVFLCENFTCQSPTSDIEKFKIILILKQMGEQIRIEIRL